MVDDYENDILNVLNTLVKTQSQREFYLNNNASNTIMRIVNLSNKCFGSVIEQVIAEHFIMVRSINSSYDLNFHNKKIEVKSSRFWVKTRDWRWQHIMIGHDYDYLLFVGVGFTSLQTFILSKVQLFKLYNMNLIKQQGNAEGQGLWFRYSKLKAYLTPVNNQEDILTYIYLN